MARNASQPSAIAMAFVLYLAISISVFGVLVIRSPARVYVGYDTDPSLMMWFLAWWPYALAHNLNPFLTKVVWAPIGYNLAWATSIPGLSLLASPITRRFGLVASYNTLCLLAPALNATGAYLLCTRLCRRFLLAFIGGYVFGFSPFVLGQELAGHVFLTFVPWVPLMLYLALLFVEQNIRSWHFIILFALFATAQCLTATETFVTAAIMGSFAVVVAALILPERIRPITQLFKVLCASALVTAVLISPYIYYALAYRERLIAGGFLLNSGVGALFVPPLDLLVSYPQIVAAAHGKSAVLLGNRDVFETRFYLGPFFLFLLLYSMVKLRQSATVRILLITGAVAWVLSLGASRQIGHYRIFLPWALFRALPFVGQAIPVRFGMYCYLDLAMLTVLFLDSLKVNWQRVVGGLLSLLFILPAVPATDRAVSTVDTPEFFGTQLFTRYLVRNEVVLVLPNSADGNAMLWQAQTDMFFRMAGGWIGGIPPEFAEVGTLALFQPGQITSARGDQLKAFLKTYGVRSVIVNDSVSSGWSDLNSVLGANPVHVGGVMFYHQF